MLRDDSLDIACIDYSFAVATLDKPSACHDRTRCAHGVTGDDYATHVNDAVAQRMRGIGGGFLGPRNGM